jgi:predicted SprT family Zn-dependent metalloprotease
MITVFTYDNSKIEQEIAKRIKEKFPDMDARAIKKLFDHQCAFTKQRMEEGVPYVYWLKIGRWKFNPKHKEKHLESIAKKKLEKQLNQED